MRATLFPLAALVAGVIGVAAAWRRPVGPGWPAALARLSFAVVAALVVAWAGGWRGAAAALVGALGGVAAGTMAPSATAALALLAFGITARAFLVFGYDEAAWRVFAAVAAGLAAGAALARRDGDAASSRYAAHTLALAGAVVAAAAAPGVANRLDAVALPVFVAAAAVLGGALAALLLRLSDSAFVSRVIAVAVFLAALWEVSGWVDPVLVGADSRPLAPAVPLAAAGAGVTAAFVASLATRTALPPPLRVAALIAAVVGCGGAAHLVAGLYGLGLAAVVALSVLSLLDPDWTV
ncbi:MAG TPA: hypothetical protein VD707_03515 [Gemmatimonadales bacterium]|nr:hypothetical protein [Gemmatimonadales bacterium]